MVRRDNYVEDHDDHGDDYDRLGNRDLQNVPWLAAIGFLSFWALEFVEFRAMRLWGCPVRTSKTTSWLFKARAQRTKVQHHNDHRGTGLYSPTHHCGAGSPRASRRSWRGAARQESGESRDRRLKRACYFWALI